MTFDYRWHVAAVGQTWNPNAKTLTSWCLTCQDYGLTCAWGPQTEAGVKRWVLDHSKWHRDTDPPGPYQPAQRSHAFPRLEDQ